jgi:hypothetical protein
MKKIYLLKQSLLLSTALLFFSCYTQAQNIFPSTGAAGIGTTTPNASSVLEMVSTSKGMLVPRMTSAQRNAILLPATGLLIYQTNSTPGFYYYSGTAWKAITPKAGWSLTGNAGTDPTVNFIGTTDAQPLMFKVNNQKAGYLDYLNYNTGFGYQTLNANASGVYNTANGYQALFANITGSENTASGFQALASNTTGVGNTANGRGALNFDTAGNFNTADGRFALVANTIGSANTATGNTALYLNTTGAFNTANGAQALYSNSTGIYNTALGYSADVSADGLSNAMALGNAAVVNASNKVVVGNSSVTVIGGYAGWSNFSDGRFKTNIKENVPGLTFINKLKPVTYNLELKKFDKFLGKKDSLINSMQADYAVSEKKVHTGFVAQDVEKSAREINYDFDGVNHPQNDKDNYSLVYADFVPSLVKAVQELNDSLVKSNASLQSQIDELRTVVQALTNKSGMMSPSKNIALSSAKLDQNIPNPFKQNTLINYYVPESAATAVIQVTGIDGEKIKTFMLTSKGNGEISLQTGQLAAGTYSYSLFINGKLVDTKKMVLTK